MIPTKQQLADEINLDPKTLGYQAAKAAGSDSQIVALLNSTYAGVGVVYRTDVLGSEILAALVWSEISNLTTNSWLALQALLIPNTAIDATQQRIRDLFAGIFAGKTVTLANLDALAKKAGPSRAEELWGYGTIISPLDVARALGRG